MNSFYKFIEKLNESQEYFDEISKSLGSESRRLIHNLSQSASDEHNMAELIFLYFFSQGKSEKEFLESPTTYYFFKDTPWKEQTLKNTYNASKHDLNTYLKIIYHDAIDAEKNGRYHFYINDFLSMVFFHNSRKKIEQKIFKKISDKFRVFFSVEELIDYITASLPKDLAEIYASDDDKLTAEINRKIINSAFNYLKDPLQGVLEGGLDA